MELGVYRLGQEDNGEVSLTAQQASQAWLEATSGDHLLPVSHLDGEGVEGALQDSVGVVVERHQGRHVDVPADQNMGGGQQLGWELCRRDLVGSSVESTV